MSIYALPYDRLVFKQKVFQDWFMEGSIIPSWTVFMPKCVQEQGSSNATFTWSTVLPLSIRTLCEAHRHVASPNDIIFSVRRLHSKHLDHAHAAASNLHTMLFCGLSLNLCWKKRFCLNTCGDTVYDIIFRICVSMKFAKCVSVMSSFGSSQIEQRSIPMNMCFFMCFATVVVCRWEPKWKEL